MPKSFLEKLPSEATEKTYRLVTVNNKITFTVQMKTIYFSKLQLFILLEPIWHSLLRQM